MPAFRNPTTQQAVADGENEVAVQKEKAAAIGSSIKEMEMVEIDVEKHVQKLEDVKKEIAILEQKRSEIEEEIVLRAQNLEDITNEIEKVERKMVLKEEDIRITKNIERKLAEIKEELQLADGELVDRTREVEAAKKELASIEKKHTEFVTKKLTEEAAYLNLQTKVSGLLAQIDELTPEVEALIEKRQDMSQFVTKQESLGNDMIEKAKKEAEDILVKAKDLASKKIKEAESEYDKKAKELEDRAGEISQAEEWLENDKKRIRTAIKVFETKTKQRLKIEV